jgi:hypothetical protein
MKGGGASQGLKAQLTDSNQSQRRRGRVEVLWVIGFLRECHDIGIVDIGYGTQDLHWWVTLGLYPMVWEQDYVRHQTVFRSINRYLPIV